MAKTTEAAEAVKKPKSVFDTSGVDEHGLKWGELTYNGTAFKLRQTTVDEGDDAYDASLNEKTSRFNSRLNSRLLLAASIVTPPTSIDDMGKWSGVKLVTLLRAYDELNVLPDADTEGNA